MGEISMTNLSEIAPEESAGNMNDLLTEIMQSIRDIEHYLVLPSMKYVDHQRLDDIQCKQ